MTMKLLDLYTALLKTASMEVTEDGYVSRRIGENSEPATIGGKRLTLPTAEHLARPNLETEIIFHPLSEHILRGESEVLEDFRKSLNITLNFKMSVLMYQLLRLGTSTGDHGKLNPEQSEFLSYIKNADKDTLPHLKKLLGTMAHDQTQKGMVSIYLKRSGSVHKKRYARVGVVNFPLYQELCRAMESEDHKVFGTKMRVSKDIEPLKKLLEYMVPGIDESEHYYRGSDSEVAPYLDALMKAVMAVGSTVNAQVDLFWKHLDQPEELQIEDGWVEVFDNLAVMLPEIRMIPMQAGNDGKPSKAAETNTAVTVTTAPTAPASALPAALTNPASTWQQPTMPAYQPAAVQKTASGKLDFNSVIANNPAVAAAGGYPMHPVIPGQMGRASYSGAPTEGGNWNTNQPSYGQPSGYHSSGL